MKYPKLIKLGVFALATISAFTVQAAVIEFRDGVNVNLDGSDTGVLYNGTHDAELRSNAADQNSNFDTGSSGSGGDTQFTVDGSDGGGVAQVVMRFDDIFGAGPAQIAYGATINSASLFIDIDNTGSDLNIFALTSGFGAESTVTWNSFGGIVPGVNAMAAPFASVDGGGNKVQVDITSLVSLWADGTLMNFGLGFVPTGNNGVDFDSSENFDFADRPMLTVDFTPAPVPLPASVYLFLGAAGFLFRARARHS